jgi:hypothetical protein
LRRRRRDALVAHLLDALKLDRVEQLYEVLLLDPGAEPVVQTSRLRLAISSVQLFVQRCLLNLEEPAVPATAIDADRWAWMKRYRVWEANRKIFLFPENWLDPELRDNRSHLFTALTGALLQGDVTDQLAEDAFVTYLRGLAEIARLEIVSVWAEADPHGAAGNTLHVIGRDHNAPRSHYYRRFAYGGWTPWERVGAQIDGDNVAAVMYRSRLHVFWVTFLEKPVPADPGNQNITDLAKITPAPQPQVDVQAQLHWTELVSGQWTPRASSDFLTVVEPVLAGSSRENLYVYATRDLNAGTGGAIIVNLLGLPGPPGKAGLRFVSRNGRPFVEGLWDNPDSQMVTDDQSPPGLTFSGKLQVKLTRLPTAKKRPPEIILAEPRTFVLATPPQSARVMPIEISALLSPFFYSDDRNTFFALPSLTEGTFSTFGGAIATGRRSQVTAENTHAIVVEPSVPQTIRVLATGQSVPASADPVDPVATFAVSATADWVTGPETVLTVGGRPVGAEGIRTPDHVGPVGADDIR